MLQLDEIGQIDSARIRRTLSDCVNDIERVRRMEEIFTMIFPEPGETEIGLYRHWSMTWKCGGRNDENPTAKGLSRKIFQRKTGMTTRQLSRLARFHAFLRRLEGGEKISVLARDSGYYDQAHLTRECRDLAGIPPRELHASLASGLRVFHRRAGNFSE